MRTRRHLALVAVLVALVAGACGNDDETGDTATRDTTAPTQRIVSLSPTATELLFAIGAGDRVVAVDDQSNHPPSAPRTRLSASSPNIEAIAGYDPDLVVSSGGPDDATAGLEELGIDVMRQPAARDLDDTYEQIRQLGRATGHRDGAARLEERMRTRLRRLVRSLPEDVEGMTYYHELDQTLFSATSDTFIGSVYGMFGLRNIADAADQDGSGYPQLSAEYVIRSDPDLIFLADTKCCGQSAETVAGRPGWSGITAVRNGGVIELDDDVASRWGPRVVDYLDVVADRLRDLDRRAAA